MMGKSDDNKRLAENPVGDELEDLRDHLERSYQGALVSNGSSFSGAAKVVFADYVMQRFLSWHERDLKARIQADRERAVAEAIEYVIGGDSRITSSDPLITATTTGYNSRRFDARERAKQYLTQLSTKPKQETK